MRNKKHTFCRLALLQQCRRFFAKPNTTSIKKRSLLIIGKIAKDVG